MELKIDASMFALAKSKHQITIEDMRTLYNEQQTVFGELTSTWKGAGGNAFRDCAAEVMGETLMGIFTLSALNSKAQDAKNYFETLDTGISKAISSK